MQRVAPAGFERQPPTCLSSAHKRNPPTLPHLFDAPWDCLTANAIIDGMVIHVLAPDVAAKIAAGEVVERPANVVKELLENSLDAGATDIRVDVREGGERLLRVTDNGHGMMAGETALAFQRHATSKLNTAEDLNQIATFGFRGEALYSIAAVSNVTLTTRYHTEEFGTQLRLESGVIIDQGKAGAPVGTVIAVEHLFHNVPARKKFLRKAATEAGHIATVVQRYALAYPERRFSFVNDGRLVFQSTGSGDLFDILVKVYGLENAKQMIPIGRTLITAGAAQEDNHPDALDLSLMGGLDDEVSFMDKRPASNSPSLENQESPVQVDGYASLPTLTRANRSNIEIFVNRRYIEDRSLTHAVVQAYHTLLPVGRYPIAVIFVEIDPDRVDVNVHPQKTQVRFVQERRVFGAVQKATRRAIIRHAPVPDLSLESPHPSSDGAVIDPPTKWTAATDWAARRATILNAGEQRHFELDASYTPKLPEAFSAAGERTPIPNDDDKRTPTEVEPSLAPASNSVTPQSGASADKPLTGTVRQLPPLRVVGQVGAMYIIAEGPEGVFLIDQHAAHERILYEKFMDQRYGSTGGENEGPANTAPARQQLLEPLTLHVGHEVTGLVAQHLEQLARVGFDIEAFGGDTFLVRAVPGVLAGQDPLRILEEIVSAMATQRNLVGEELEARLVKMVCKRAAVKAGQLLSTLEMQELIHQLEACRSPRTCPHGRPTMIQLSAGELEKAFGRM